VNKAFNILLIAAVLVGLFSAYLVVRLLKGYQNRPATSAQQTTTQIVETQKVAFARVEIKPGTRYDPSLVEMKDMPVKLVPDGVIGESTEMGDVYAVHFISEGEMLMQSKFKEDEKMTRASLVIPKGMRTITVTIDEIRGNAFMVKAGDIVDIILSGELEVAGENPTLSRIFMQAVKVFDIVRGNAGEERTGEEPEGAADSRRGTGTNVTFLVTPQEAEIIHNASINTTLTLILRRYDDTEIVQTSGVIDGMLMEMVGISDFMGDTPPPPPEPEPESVVEQPTRLFY
jgi:pilus assembly protein CpaB